MRSKQKTKSGSQYGATTTMVHSVAEVLRVMGNVELRWRQCFSSDQKIVFFPMYAESPILSVDLSSSFTAPLFTSLMLGGWSPLGRVAVVPCFNVALWEVESLRFFKKTKKQNMIDIFRELYPGLILSSCGSS